MPRKKTPRHNHYELDEEQWAFARAMNELKKRLGRYPHFAEVLAEAKRLGYRKEK